MTDPDKPNPTSTPEPDGTRSLVFEREIAAPPEDVWRALTTPEGLRQWFPLDARVTPEASGSIWLSWGPGCEGEAPIHIWEPNRRFGWTESYGEDDSGKPIKVAVDFYLEGREGQTVIRLVQSGISAASDWDEMYDALKDGWTYFLFNLGYYFLKHRKLERKMVWRRVATDLARDALWERLTTGALIGTAIAGGGGSGVGAESPAELVLDQPRPCHIVSQREGYHFAATLPNLGDSIFFVEIEGPHVGLWLSTYGMDEPAVDGLQEALDARVEEVFG